MVEPVLAGATPASGVALSKCAPTCSRAHLLPGLFGNLARLTGPFFELVIVNDGSPDDSAERGLSFGGKGEASGRVWFPIATQAIANVAANANLIALAKRHSLPRIGAASCWSVVHDRNSSRSCEPAAKRFNLPAICVTSEPPA